MKDLVESGTAVSGQEKGGFPYFLVKKVSGELHLGRKVSYHIQDSQTYPFSDYLILTI
jgi:hypothetical protein